MGKPKIPSPPDPQATIAAQSSANTQSALENAQLNRVNQYTPWGSSTWSTAPGSGGIPQYSQTTTLSPSEQTLFNLGEQGKISLGNIGTGTLGQVAGQYANPLDYSGVPRTTDSINGGQTYPDAIRQAQDAAYRSQTQYLDPRFQQGQSQLDNSLINQGITQGSEAANNAQTNFDLQRRGAYQSAQDAAVQAGDSEAANIFNRGLGQANLTNNASQQAMQQLYAQRNEPLNEFNALLSGSQVNTPQFTPFPTANVATTDVAGIQNASYQSQLAAYQARMAANPWNSILSLAGNLGAAAISDRRLKRDIRKIGELPSGIPVYDFRYLDQDAVYRGVMADEVLPIIPEAVLVGVDGFYRVDYSKVR